MHGLSSLFAAKLVADVITLEPQGNLCQAINSAKHKNGKEVADHITLYHNAALDSHETITLKQAEIEHAGGGSERIEAFPITDFIPPTEKRRVNFLKIDVEGFELHAFASAKKLFLEKRVDNVLVEFGPPSRWKSAAGTDADASLKLIREMQETYMAWSPD